MTVEKNGKIYIVNECKKHWTVKYTDGGLSVSYEVDKDLCKTESELSEYIKENDIF